MGKRFAEADLEDGGCAGKLQQEVAASDRHRKVKREIAKRSAERMLAKIA